MSKREPMYTDEMIESMVGYVESHYRDDNHIAFIVMRDAYESRIAELEAELDATKAQAELDALEQATYCIDEDGNLRHRHPQADK
jgi:peroxiredoxin